MEKVEMSRLPQVAKSSAMAKAVFSLLASRERASRFTNLAQFRHILKNGFKKKGEKKFTFSPVTAFDREAYDKVWLALESLGFGKVGYTPRGMAIHFEWDGWEASSIGTAALDPKKQPIKSEFRDRPLVEKKFHSKVVKNHPKRPVQVLPKKTEISQRTRDVFEDRPVYSGARVFANFMTESLENIKLDFKKGLTEDDKERLIDLIKELPVNQ